MPRIAHIEIRSDPPQVPGSVVRHILSPEARQAFASTLALNGESRATLTLPTDADAWRYVRRMDCLRVVYLDGSARSWRIAADSLTEDARTGELVLTCCEILLDLGYVRLLRNETTGSAPQLSRTYAPMTPSEILGDILRELHEVGEALHIQLGTVQPTALIVHDRTYTTALEVLRAVASHPQVACEYQLRETATAFYLDLVQRVALGHDPVHVWYGGNLGSLVRQRSAAQLASVVIPRGESDDVTCAATVFEVTHVTADYVRVRDPEAPSAPPIVCDGQFVGAYAVRPVDGSLRRIVATRSATQNVYLTGSTGFVAGDLFELRRDLAGNRLITRTNPAAALPRHKGGVGRIERVVSVAASQSGRNYVRNPFFREWTLGADGVIAPVGWSTKALNARRLDVPESPSGTSFVPRFTGAIGLTGSVAAGATSAPTLSARLARLGEMIELWAGGVKVHTSTVVEASASRLGWADPTPTLASGVTARVVGVYGATGASVVTSGRIRLPADVTAWSFGVLVLKPAGPINNGLAVRVYRYRAGVGGRTAVVTWDVVSPGTGVPAVWVTMVTEDGLSHTQGDQYEVELSITGSTPQMLPEIAWVYVGDGAVVPPHDMVSGAFDIPEYSGANKLHRAAQAALIEMAPDRASYQLSVIDLTDVDGERVTADRFVVGGPMLLHHDQLDSVVSARVLTITENEDEPESAELSLDSTEPDVARTLALLLGGRADAAQSSGGVLSGPWPITAEASPANGGLVSGAGRYVRGQPVELVAIPQPSFVFVRWMEGTTVVATTPRYVFAAGGPRALIAEYQYQPPGNYAISVTADPAGWGTVSGAGSYAHNAAVSVKATPASGYSFSQWTDGGVTVSTAATYNFTALASRDLVAVFIVTPPGNSTITLSASPSGYGTVSGGGSYTNGTTATVSATPAAGKVFSRWTDGGSAVSSSRDYAFQVTGARTLVAEFADAPPGPWAYVASVSPAGSGSVSGAGTYPHGATVTLTATPATGYRFKQWTEQGVGVGANPVYTVPAAADADLVAEFELLPPGPWTITARAEPDTYGDVFGLSNPYDHGATVNLTAVPIGARAFVRWLDNGVEISTDPNLSFTATANRALLAEFGVGGGGEDT